jgi:hypothetical protein
LSLQLDIPVTLCLSSVGPFNYPQRGELEKLLRAVIVTRNKSACPSVWT